MKNLSLFLILLLAAAKPSMGQGQVDTILNRYCRYLYQTEHPRSTDIDHWVRTISSEGRWPDINYTDEHRANWQLWTHLKRLDQLSVAWRNPASSFYHDGKAWKAINLALDDWLRHRYQNPNWWHNQIGVPQCMRDIIILLRDTLSAKQLKGALAVMAQLHVQKSGAGANLIWSADLGFHYGALTGDEALMDSCRKLIVEEIHISTGEGIQPDYSFHQHGSRLQMYQYGKAFLFSNIRLAWELHGTRWAYPPSRIRILRNFLLKGWQWMARGVNTVPGTMDRSASRVGELRSPDIRFLIPFLCELDPRDASKFRTLADHQNGKEALSGFRYYPYSDFTAYQRKSFSFFLKTISTRTLPTEVGLNAENLKGRLLNSGDGYLIGDGKEYYNLMPVWDWQKLPGTTAFKDAYKIDRQPFSGSVTDEQSGLSAMAYGLEDSTGKQHMSAHKVWACHQNMVVCLVADLQADHIPGQIYTVLDQCRQQGPVMVNKPDHVIGEGTDQLSGVRWIYHAGFAYLPLKPARVTLKLG
jgi:chondroitin AC lyase